MSVGRTVTASNADTSRLRIACVIHSLDGGGAERVMAELASRLSRRGHDIHLITLDDGRSDRHPVDADVTRHCLDCLGDAGRRVGFSGKAGRVVSTIGRLRRLRQTIRRLSPDRVLSFCDSMNVHTLAACLGMNVPVAVCERSDPSRQMLPGMWQRLRPRLYRRAAAVIVQTRRVARTWAAGFGDAVVVIPSAVEAPAGPPRDGDAAWDTKTIVGVGRLSVEKGFDRLIDAFAANADRHLDWTLKIVGDGNQREMLQQRAIDHGIADRVRFVGWQSPIWPVYQTASLVAITSHYEGFPSVLMEAMACGVPSLAVRDLGGVDELIEDRINGRVCDDNVESIASVLGEMIVDRDAAMRMGRRAKNVQTKFSWDVMVDRFESVLRRGGSPSIDSTSSEDVTS